MVEDNRTYSSGLTQEELASLWEALMQKFPLLYDKFLHPDFTSADSDEELRSRDGGLHYFIHSAFPNSKGHQETDGIYCDMKIYFDRNLRIVV